MHEAQLFAGQRLGVAGLQSRTEALGGVINSQSGPACHTGGVVPTPCLTGTPDMLLPSTGVSDTSCPHAGAAAVAWMRHVGARYVLE